jgi:hypothetical protein
MACIWVIFISFPPYYVKYNNTYGVGRCFLFGDHYAHAPSRSNWYEYIYVNGNPDGKKCQIDSSRFFFETIALITFSFISIAIYYKKISAPELAKEEKRKKSVELEDSE